MSDCYYYYLLYSIIVCYRFIHVEQTADYLFGLTDKYNILVWSVCSGEILAELGDSSIRAFSTICTSGAYHLFAITDECVRVYKLIDNY